MRYQQGCRISAIVLGTLIFCCCCCTFVQRNRIGDAIDVIDASMDFLRSTKRIILLPVAYFIVQVAFTIGWLYVLVAIISTQPISPLTVGIPVLASVLNGDEIEYEQVTIPQAKHIEIDVRMVWIIIYMTFGLFWITSFLDFQCQFVINVAACSYYFDSNKEKEGDASILLGFKSAFFHVGSIAFGSFFIAMIKTLTTFLSYLKTIGIIA